ncbi:PDZK1-interacting protein 1 [Erpetoichthys calabaricus]|uniref:PDZK1-interacting protein 1 n=1 Tax=Erpetoichthys calabaricus TaxID=27687 RepID=UPI002234635D|nr:PDZK1-interacting protein 1 [Erpetoichthys calabaricus]
MVASLRPVTLYFGRRDFSERGGEGGTMVNAVRHSSTQGTMSTQALCLCFLISSVAAQQGRASSTSSTKSLQPWLVGLIAVVGFLFLVFTLMILNRLFCKKETSEEESNINTEGRDNPGLETELDEVDTNNCQHSDF